MMDAGAHIVLSYKPIPSASFKHMNASTVIKFHVFIREMPQKCLKLMKKGLGANAHAMKLFHGVRVSRMMGEKTQAMSFQLYANICH
jgi:hypothetical protein